MSLALPMPRNLEIPKVKGFELVSESLIHLQVIPHFNIQNGRKIENIIDGLHSLYKPINERFSFKKGKIQFHLKENFYYSILLEKDNISFYYSIPESYQRWFTQRVYSTWTNQVTIIPLKNDFLDKFDERNTIEYIIKPKYKSYKSFVCDYRENAPIPSILSCNKDLQENDRILLELCLNPVVDGLWKEWVEEQQKKYRYGSLVEVENGGKIGFIADKLFELVDGFLGFIDILFEVDKPSRRYGGYGGRNSSYYDDDYSGSYYDSDRYSYSSGYGSSKKKKGYSTHEQLSSASRQKINYNGFQGKIRILSESEDKVRSELGAKTLSVGLKDIAEDNEFIMEKVNTELGRTKINFIFGNHVYSSKEIGQIVQLPEKKWQEEYPVEKVEVQEIKIPKELLQGGVQLGIAKFKGQTTDVYWNKTDINVACLPKCWIGYQGSGKTEALKNHGIRSVEQGHGLIVLDGIQSCGLSDDIRNYLPKDFPEHKIIELNFADLTNIIPLGWNEIESSKINPQEKLKFSNIVAQELIKFLDSLVDSNEQKLSPRMRRYLSSAALLTFMQKDSTMMTVLECLTEYDVRHKIIKDSGLSEENKLIKDMLELDDKDNSTKTSIISGIIDRLDLLLGDYVLSNLFSTKGCEKIDFKKWIKEGYVVLCRMPQDELSDQTIKTLTTFLISKIWFAKLMLGKNNVVHTTVIADEVHRTQLKFENIREMRKFGLEYVFSAHQPSDFKHILNTLKSAGCSFMLLNTTKDNISHFESEIRPYTIQEVMDMKKYHSLCIVNYDKTFVSFIAKLPDLLPKDRFIDRSYLTQKCAEKYGVKV